ncbi:hypothetical protein FISHEDRAFT_36397 [Fistulina hepatica ATCC 64428]|uniref:Mitochondrial F1F0-ATP synthase g subunit n=1 Tax=Fistulina hepatica ATCC 64428 TaxID=1128425 RepID=A0A0D7AJ90_9AGAR|nr:hypothetical protein FISHEDRAFT_36397 [Fistulina hepatica ATCC 64428]
MRPVPPLATLRNAVTRRSHRSSRHAPRRWNSSSPKDNAEKAKETLANSDTFVTVQKQVEQYWQVAKKALGPTGEKAVQLLGGYKEPVLYNLAVAREVAKLIYRKESMSPPRLADFMPTYRQLWSRASSRSYWTNALASGELMKVGIYGLEAYGIFKIGEIVGRRHLVGYGVPPTH